MSIVIEEATKTYGANAVVKLASLQIEAGEFLVLIGPSGSGKSTLLRMIAGLTTMDSGRIWLHEREVTDLPPQKRGVGFVFQNYALFQHMSASENIAYGLQVRKVAAKERHHRVDELLDLVGLKGLGHRLPGQLSGGQQQRVALARALAFNPEVLLLDEPFGALDAKIRTELRRSIKRIQREIGISTIFVTHDQEEAFSLADRVGLMHDGELVEIGASEDLYHTPCKDFTATFLGSANLLLGLTSSKGIKVGEADLPMPTNGDHQTNRIAKILVRPEDILVSKLAYLEDSRFVTKAIVNERIFCGSSERLRLAINPRPGLQVLHPTPKFGSEEVYIEALRTRSEIASERILPGDSVNLSFRRIHCLEVLNTLPILGGRHAIEFLKAERRDGLATKDSSARMPAELPQSTENRSGADSMEIDTDKILVWFGEPKRIERLLINLSGRENKDRELIRFAKQTFCAGRPPNIELLYVRHTGHGFGDSYQKFMAASKRELLQLSTTVRTSEIAGDPIEILSETLNQNDCDLLIGYLPSEAESAQASGDLTNWVIQRIGPVASMFFIPPTSQRPSAEQAA
jgi:ABC-type Fe3+/spermidine/putrescine transport system ATPase subunit